MLSGGPVASFLADLARRLRRDAPAAARPPAHSDRREARPYLLRALAAYDRWLGASRELGTTDLLANAASVQRWEFLSWHDRLIELVPPGDLQHLHFDV